MHDLKSQGSASHLAVAAQPQSARQPLLLGGREMEEPQGEKARPIADPAQELAAPAVGHFGELDFAFDHRVRAWRQTAERRDVRAVLIACGQQEQQVLNLRDAKSREALGKG